ncbi:MAG: PfkB family carbohydrate kinase [Thermodesulfobacteriota bacterium]
MPQYDIIIIGHITSDTLEYNGEVTRFTGGAAYFSSFAAKRSNAKICVVTKLAQKDFGVLDQLREEGIKVIAISSSRTTSIENVFETDDFDKRKARLISQADPFNPEDIPEVETKIYYLAGLFSGEIPHALIESLSKKGEVGLDMQAMLRSSKEANIGFKDWAEKRHYLPMVTYLKADSLESEVATGTSDREKAARMLYEWGAKEVMITHASEVILYNGERVFRAPFNPKNLSGRTGRGDTCFVSYMSWRLNHGIEESVRYAAVLTSIKMEKPGPFLGTIDDVLARMKTP